MKNAFYFILKALLVLKIPYLSNQAVFLPDQKNKTKKYISWEWKELLRWKKTFFIIFKGLLVAKNCLRP